MTTGRAKMLNFSYMFFAVGLLFMRRNEIGRLEGILKFSEKLF